jgi:hypothetical protein
MNSGQSQKEAVGSMVEQYTTAAMANVSQPIMLSTILNCFIFCCLIDIILQSYDYLA